MALQLPQEEGVQLVKTPVPWGWLPQFQLFLVAFFPLTCPLALVFAVGCCPSYDIQVIKTELSIINIKCLTVI